MRPFLLPLRPSGSARGYFRRGLFSIRVGCEECLRGCLALVWRAP
jgi:hypothetical protein